MASYERNMQMQPAELIAECAFHLYDTYFRPLYAEYRRCTNGPVLGESGFFHNWMANSNEGEAFQTILGQDKSAWYYFYKFRS